MLKAPGSAKLLPIAIIGSGLVAVILGAVPMGTQVRGVIALLIGLGPMVALSTVPEFNWRVMVLLVGMVLLVTGLLVRSKYTHAVLGRAIATAGVVIVLAVYLIPENGQLPMVGMFKMLGAAPGKAKLLPIIGPFGVALVPLVVTLACLLVWLPGPGTAGSAILAWTAIVWAIVASLAMLLISGAIGAALKAGLSEFIYLPVAMSAWLAFAGYGGATLFGKSLETP